jgi:hypothetical protein
MKTGSIPSWWLAAFGWEPEFNLELLKRVRASGIDPNDMEKVRPIAEELSKLEDL